MSMPVQAALAPSARASASVVAPVPQPTSSTCAHGAARAAATIASSSGRNARSSVTCNSAQASPLGPFQSLACASLASFAISMIVSSSCLQDAERVAVQVNLRSSMRFPDIAEVAQRAGVPASTLRFYEEKGLIVSVGRRGLRRLFDASVFERLG